VSSIWSTIVLDMIRNNSDCRYPFLNENNLNFTLCLYVYHCSWTMYYFGSHIDGCLRRKMVCWINKL